MYAVLLNPPRKRKKLKRKPKWSKACRRTARKRAAWTSARTRRSKARRKRKFKASMYKSFRTARKSSTRKRKSPKRKTKARKRRTKKQKSDAFFKSISGTKLSGRPTARNPRRRKRRRSRNRSNYVPAMSRNPRRASYKYGRRHRKRNRSNYVPSMGRNPSWVPSYAMNPGAGGILKSVTKGFSPTVLKKAAPMAAGALGNAALTKVLAGYLPSMFSDGIGNAALGLASAGLLGAGAGMVKAGWAGPVFLGGVIEVVTMIATEKILPMIGLSGCMGCGMGEWGPNMLTKPFLTDFADTTGLDNDGVVSFPTATGLDPYPYGMSGIGDYLTRSNAAEARPLGGLGGLADMGSVEGYMLGLAG